MRQPIIDPEVSGRIGMAPIQDCRLRANVTGLTPEEAKIAKKIYNTIPQYRIASKVLDMGKIYIRTAPHHGYKDLSANCGSAYIWDNETKSLNCIIHNCGVYRLHEAVNHYQDYIDGIISTTVWENYITNGYNTRRGLMADYSKTLNRMNEIARSHANLMGCETGDSTTDHMIRVRMRN